ncbi:MAG: DUF2202 domain-containing protein [Thiolinea sp.]
MKISKPLLFTLSSLLAASLAFTAPATQAAGYGYNSTNGAALQASEAELLVFMREEEKLARDVYLTLYKKWGLSIFQNIASSEQQHTDRIKALLQTYGLVDPVVANTVGVFTDATLANLYNQLVTQGKRSKMKALQVGALIEETDILDLQTAIASTQHQDIVNVYNNLMKGSRNHLRAFSSQIENRGTTYEAQVLSQEEVDAIIDSPQERGNANQRGGGRRNR